jgi:hypothetical protein
MFRTQVPLGAVSVSKEGIKLNEVMMGGLDPMG